VGIILVLGLVLRLIVANTLPLTNDEGSYLYDAYLLGRGHLPFLTSFSRAPALMIPLSLWLKVFGVSVFSGRLFMSLVSLGSAILLYFIGKEIFGRKLGLITLTLYALVSPVAIHSSYLLTEPLEIFYSLLGSLFLIKLVRNGRYWAALLSGLGFGLAMATRETAAIYPLFLGLFLLFQGRFNLSKTIKPLLTTGIIAILVWSSFWGLIALQVGLKHVVKNFEAILKMHDTGERLTFGFVMRRKLGEFWYLKIDYGLFYVLTTLFGVFAVIKRWYRDRRFRLLLALSLGPILFYGLYYKGIQPEYFSSFMPGFVLMSSYLICRLNLKLYGVILAGVLLIVVNGITFRHQLSHPRGGTFYLKPLENVVTWVKSNTAPNDQIFTAAVSIPLFADRALALDISRPVIFGYPHIEPDIKYALFPTPEEVVNYLTVNQVKYYIVEKATRDSFYTGHDGLKAYLMKNYEHLKTFDNPTNPIELWVRKQRS